MAGVDGGDPIEVVDPDPAWAVMGEEAAAEVRQVLGPWLVDVEHIGSTAVPGLAAKPVIDAKSDFILAVERRVGVRR